MDWQNNFKKIKTRNQYLLKSEKLSDCRFLVGTSPNQSLIAGHRLILAAASPVFELMFFGSLPEKNDPIIIPDVLPDAFAALLEYIYTDEISISSFDNACGLYNLAKKYMMPHVVELCTNLMLSDLCSKNACRAYELGILYEEPRLKESSMDQIVFNTRQVITDPSFVDVEDSTLMTILDQSHLNIDSELELFNCLLTLANAYGIMNIGDKETTTNADSNAMEEMVSNSGTDEVVVIDGEASASGNAGETTTDKLVESMLQKAIKKIRFLAMTPQEFAEGPARSKLLKQNDAFALLLNILNPTHDDCPMPEGFCQLRKRERSDINHKVKRSITTNTTFLGESNHYETCLTFKVNTNISLLGVHISLKSPLLQHEFHKITASIQDMQGSEIACTSFIESKIDSTYELTFTHPVLIIRNQKYVIKLINIQRFTIQVSAWDSEMFCEDVKFSFVAVTPNYIDFRSTICSLVFAKQHDLSCNYKLCTKSSISK